MKSQLSLKEIQISEAITGDITIGKHNEIKPFNAEKLLKETLTYCSITSGINAAIDPVTAANFREYFFSDLKNYTFEEVKRAVYFNATGEFPERINPFNLFDVNFLSSVMTEWLILKTQTRTRIAALLPKPKDPEPETDQQRYQGLLNYINSNGSFPDFWSWVQVWDYMSANGLIKDSEEEKKALWKKVKSELEIKLELELLSVPDFIERTKLKEDLPERVTSEYRKRRIMNNLSHLLPKQNKPSST